MRRVPDGIGTAPIGVRLAPDGQTVYVANYLSRNVVPAVGAEPQSGGGQAGQLPLHERPATSPAAPTTTARRRRRLLQPPRRRRVHRDEDCGDSGPCIRSGGVRAVDARRAGSRASPAGSTRDPLHPSLLDGKILFNTAARDSSMPNRIGLGSAAPLFNDPVRTGRVPGSVVSVAHDASYVTCTSCHADYGGQDGRTWDFSQFGASLRNTMDLRGRSGFAPGRCSDDADARRARSTPPAARRLSAR